MQGFCAVLKRELKGYFATPVAYVFLVIFLFAAGYIPFSKGFFEMRQANLRLFFDYLPLLFVFMVPATAMRLWAEERKSGSVELLLTLPITVTQAVLGKYFAAWLFLGIALLLTLPMPLVVAYLGDPDVGQIVTGYIGAYLMAGAFLAVGSFFSALSKNQVVSFILSIVACAVLVFAGHPTSLNYLSKTISPNVIGVLQNLSIQTHFESMMRGVIEFKDIAYFILIIMAWVYGCMVLLVDKTFRMVFSLFFVAVIAVSGISLSQDMGKNMRVDMTDHKLYTLSDGTKEILADLKQPVTLKLFYAETAALEGPDQIRFYNNYYAYVKALLEEYELHAAGKVNLEIVDPRPYTEDELAAIRYGLRRFNITEDESFFFGLVLQTEFGVTKTIDFFTPDRQQFVEYDISYLIDTAVTRQKTRVGVLSSLPVMGDSEYMLRMMQMQGQQGNRKWGIISHLEKQYEVSQVPTETDTIENVDLLLVIHPKNLSEQTQFAIDQYILKGGRAVVCIDPHAVIDMPSQQQQMYGEEHDSSSNLPTLLSAWGLKMPAATFAGDRKLAVLRAPRPGQRPEKILGIMTLTGSDECFNSEDPVTAQLSEVTTVFPGLLERIEAGQDDSGLTYSPLLQTTDKGNAWNVSSSMELANPNFNQLMRNFRDGSEPVRIGYMVTGSFKSAFPDGIVVTEEPAEDETSDSEAPEPITKTITGLNESEKPGSVVVFADVDMFSDMVAYQRSFFGLATVGDNSTLMLNTLEAMAGSERLISIRSRGGYERPFTVVQEIETQAEAETLEETRAIEVQVQGFQNQLNEKINSLEGDNKGELINQTILDEKEDIELELRKAEKRLRDIKMQKRERVEALKQQMRNYCTLVGPGIMLLIAVILGLYRGLRSRYYISHSSDA